jgi:DNA polymerase bacteriophage-type
MTRVTIDYESRSACDLKSRGSWVYSEHPTTDILCLGYKFEGQPAGVLAPGEDNSSVSGHILDAILDATEIWAHNAFFEYSIWTNVAVKKYGWPSLPVEKLRCSAAVAAQHALPRSLAGACAALGLPIQKDQEGAKVMMRLCKPARQRADQGTLMDLTWNENPADLARLYEYCKRDVEAEEALLLALRPLPVKELEIWQLDQTINRRGIQADLAGAAAMLGMVEEHEAILLARLARLTHGLVKTGKQTEALRAYLRGLGVDLPDLAAATVKEALAGPMTQTARDILEIRQSLARSSSAKYQAIINRASADGRVRDSQVYHGAQTGRFSGSGIQPHNFPSRIKTTAKPEEMLGVVSCGGLDLFGALYEDDPMAAAGATTRSVLTAAPGHDLIAADYSAIEGRGLAWLAGEETELEIYRAGRDIYVETAASILGKRADQVTKEERNKIGKTATLACGYQGSVGAVRKFGGDGLTDDEIKQTIVYPWREAHPRTVAFWAMAEEAAVEAVEHPGAITSARSIRFRSCPDKFLKVRLPSGRLLYYYDPRMDIIETPRGPRRALTYMTVDSVTRQWVRTSTYGGKLVENLTQAACRCVMAEAMLRIEAAGYPIVLTVHDEILAEVPEGFGSVEEFVGIMEIVPTWATGFPIKAAGWRGRRYRK